MGGGEEEVFIPSRDPNMITIQSTSSTEPLNVRPIMAEEVELHGDIKIQKVAHTRWTPQKKSQEQVQRPHSNPVTTPPTATLPKPVRNCSWGLELKKLHFDDYSGTLSIHYNGFLYCSERVFEVNLIPTANTARGEVRRRHATWPSEADVTTSVFSGRAAAKGAARSATGGADTSCQHRTPCGGFPPASSYTW